MDKYKTCNPVLDDLPESVYHYTGMPTLLGLLDTRSKGVGQSPMLKFRATDIETFNDREEYVGMRKLLKDIKNSKVDAMFQEAVNGLVFAISFSFNEDNMFMWRQYADAGRGICLKFNTHELVKHLIPQNQEPYEFTRFGRCFYEEPVNVKREKLEAFYAVDDFGQDIWERQDCFVDFQLSSSFVKNKGFMDERECRLVKISSDYRFSVNKHGFFACVEVDVPFSCLEEIMIGPCSNFEIASHTVEKWAEPITSLCGSHQIRITKSSVII